MRHVSELQLLDAALDRALAITGQTLGNVQLVDWNAGSMEIVAQRGFAQDFLECFHRVSIKAGSACGRALLLRDTIVIHDVTTDPQFSPFRDIAERSGFRAVQSTPLVSSGDALLGIISTHGSRSPTQDQLAQVKTLARTTADELVRLRAHLSKQKRTVDELSRHWQVAAMSYIAALSVLPLTCATLVGA